MADHTIEIKAFPPVAVVAPGIRDVRRGEEIEFVNQTGGPIKIFTAEDFVFRGIKRLKENRISTDDDRTFTIDAPEGKVTIDGATQHVYKTARIGVVQPDGLIKEVWNSGGPIKPDPYLKDYPWAKELS